MFFIITPVPTSLKSGRKAVQIHLLQLSHLQLVASPYRFPKTAETMRWEERGSDNLTVNLSGPYENKTTPVWPLKRMGCVAFNDC